MLWSERVILRPKFARRPDHELEFLLLFFGGDRITKQGRRKTTLRANTELRKREIIGSRPDAPA